MRESDIPEYNMDARGVLYRNDAEGKWYSLDIEGDHLIALNSTVLKERAMNRARVSNRTTTIPAKWGFTPYLPEVL